MKLYNEVKSKVFTFIGSTTSSGLDIEHYVELVREADREDSVALPLALATSWATPRRVSGSLTTPQCACSRATSSSIFVLPLSTRSTQSPSTTGPDPLLLPCSTLCLTASMARTSLINPDHG